ncbi:MAG TPA: DUF1326 domain-containing protein [Isosphaeraceae bacterium]|nr:DUF1326 domain-containing protein [Isosphaeraceae bacterium]
MRTITRVFGAILLSLVPAVAGAAGIRGDYVEARNADVYTGPCFSNAEVLIHGQKAVLAWKVNQGSWKGVDLAGLCVAAAVQGNTTFSEDDPEQARAVLIVDSRANSRQREALIDLARTLGGARLGHLTQVTATRMSLTLEDHPSPDGDSARPAHAMPHAPRASFWAAGIARIVTRPLDERDHACGNEVIAYPPLSRTVSVQPAYTLGHEFKGQGLDGRWDDPNCRSSFVGHFAY